MRAGVLVTALLLGGGAVGLQGTPFRERLPGRAAFYARLGSLEEVVGALADTPAGRLAGDPEGRAFFAPLLEVWRRFDREARQLLGRSPGDLAAVFRGPLLCAWGPALAGDGRPGFVAQVGLRPGGRETLYAALLRGSTALSAMGAARVRWDVLADARVLEVTPREEDTLYLWVSRGWFGFATAPSLVEAVLLGRDAELPAPEVLPFPRAVRPAGAHLFLQLEVTLGESMPEGVPAWRAAAASVAAAVRTITVAWRGEAGAFRERVHLRLRRPRRGGPAGLTLAGWVPAGALAYAGARLPRGRVAGLLARFLADGAPAVPAAALGDEAAVALLPGGIPGVLAFVTLEAPGRMSAWLERTSRVARPPWRRRQTGGAPFYVLSAGGPGRRPAVAVYREHLVLASRPEVLQRWLRRKGQPHLAAAPAFREALRSAGPTRLSECVGLLYLDVPRLVAAGSILAEPWLLAREPLRVGWHAWRAELDWSALPSPETLARAFAPAAFTLRPTAAGGLLGEGRTPVPGLGVAVASLAAGFGVGRREIGRGTTRLRLGIYVDDEYGGDGIRVAGVVPGSPAAAAGLAAGDILARIGEVPLGSPWAAAALLARYHPGAEVTLLVLRGGKERTVRVRLDGGGDR